MKSKILSILLLLVVVTAFSGVASAASHQVLVKDAWDEVKLVSEEIAAIPGYIIPAVTHQEVVPATYKSVVDVPEHTVTVEDTPAYIAQVFDHYLVSGAYTIHHPAVLVSEEVPAYDELITPAVPEVPAYDELISEEVPAWDELISEAIPAVPAYDELLEQKFFNTWNGAEGWAKAQVRSGHADSYEVFWSWNGCKYVVVANIFEHHDAVPAVPAVYKHHDAIPAVYEHHDAIPEVPAVYLHHDAIPAVYTPAYDEQVPYSGNGPYFGQFGNSADINAWANWIYSHPGAIGGYGHWDAYYNSTLVPAVTHEETIPATYKDVEDVPSHEITVTDVPEIVVPEVPAVPAVYETIHHDAIYTTVVDPVTPVVKPVVKPVSEVAEPATIPMQHTGSSPYDAAAIIGAALLILGGFGIVVARRKDDEDEE